ncbi:MAG TPA: xanthine dehydrogenase molybdopterin binding subunit [Chthoniobacterales bacterium]|nr:xanthine dehydrogenase molybdopterin binding subunit [Chthoniobacterales bacterium]
MHAPRSSPSTRSDSFEIIVNGVSRQVRGISAQTSLLDWLRLSGLTGTKEGCAEGDCGACTVALIDRNASGKAAYRAVNSCIALLPMFAGREIVTVDGLARGEQLHPAQHCMVRQYGSQCGYCTPGFVMSLFEGAYREGMSDYAAVADQLSGNLCRCTGYRPIRDAACELFKKPLEDEFSARLEQSPIATETGDYGTGESVFIRPQTMDELFALRSEHPEAALIAGATEIGVEINKKFRKFPSLISVEGVDELRTCQSSNSEWRLGAGATLTQIEEKLAGEYPSLAQMIRVFASRQIRNRATLGGNLVTASPIGDSAPVLLSLGAEVELGSIRGRRRVPLAEFFTGYRRTVLAPDEVMTAVLLPRETGAKCRTAFLKVSKRREMDISIVAGAFYLNLDKTGVVLDARMAFGGVAASPALVKADLLVGRRLDPATVDEMAELLSKTFSPITDARGSASFRAELVVNLWRKFASGDQSEAQEIPPNFAPDDRWTITDESRDLPHESGVWHVTGRAQYVEDIALRRGGMLTLWPVCSPHAHARILKLDTSAAERMPGVSIILTAKDVPGINDVGCSRPDEILLADEIVEFHGHMVAVVIGESKEACQAAAKAVSVEYEPLEPVLTIADAIAKDSFHTEFNFIRRGDVSAALDASPNRLEGTFEFGGQEHFYLESHAAWAEVLPDGGIFVSSSTQHPTEIQIIVARVLGLQRNEVVVEAPRMGGGFGGKETQGNTWAALAALGSLKTGRPVRVQLDRDLDMALSGKRHPFHSAFEVGFDDEGHILGARVTLISNGGWSLDLSMPITDRALFHLDNAYYLPAVEFSGRAAKTHLVSNTAFRGFGGPQGMLVIEEIVDRVARFLGTAPEIVRERNLYHGRGETNTTPYGQEVGDNRVRTLWTSVLGEAAFQERRAEVDAWNATHPMVKRGLAITPVKFGISFTFTPYNQAGALLLAYADGTVQVNHGGTEMGQGLYTKILGIAMRELGLPKERIRLMPTRTDKVPNTSATAASSGADLNGAAVRDACVKLKQRLRGVAAGMLKAPDDAEVLFANGRISFTNAPEREVTFPEVCAKAHMDRVSLSASGFYKTPEIHWDRAAGKGMPFYYFASGVSVSEVEVDGWTGMHNVRRVDILHDVGESLNPSVDRGQIEGGFVQGMGWLTREELLWDGTGRLLTHSASTYAIPAFSDAPSDFRVHLMPNAAQAGVVHGSKAVGEPPLMLAISVREAIRDAVSAFGPTGGEAPLASPATCEAIFFAIRQRLEKAS